MAAEVNAHLPQAITRDEKGLYAETYFRNSRHAHEVALSEDADKEVDNRAELQCPEAIVTDSPLYPLNEGVRDDGRNGSGLEPTSSLTELKGHPKRATRLFCGLTKRRLIFIILVCILVVGVAVGAGLGTTLPKQSKSSRISGASSTDATLAALTSTRSATVSSATPTPTLIDFRERVKYNLTVWEGKNFTGKWLFIDRVGYYDLGFVANSYFWRCGNFTPNLQSCSMAFCQDEEDISWRGSQDRKLEDIGSVTKRPNRAKILCGNVFANPGCAKGSYSIISPTAYPSAPIPDSTAFATVR